MKFEGSLISKNSTTGEIRLMGLPVARGIAIGKIVPLHGQKRQYVRAAIDESFVPSEIQKLESAFKTSLGQLGRLLRSVRSSKARADIISAHIAILDDRSFRNRIEELIQREKVNAEWAVSSIGDEYISRFKSIPDEHMRERYFDIQDVVDRVLSSFAKSSGSLRQIPKGVIIAASELSPSTIVDFGSGHIAGCLTEHGGWTSHTFILAREQGLPAVTGIRNLLRLVGSGQDVIVDGFRGEAILSPTESTLSQYSKGKPATTALRSITKVNTSGDLRTIDGRKISIRLNADSSESVNDAKAFGTKGVGLFRTEILFNRYNGFPSERQQVSSYRKLAEAAGDHGIRIRTFDVGTRQMDSGFGLREKNPALGRRGIRLAIEESKQLKCQLRAILQASVGNKIDIILPMVTGLAEIRQAKEILSEQRKELTDSGKRSGDVRFGAMIEVPSAVLMIDEILSEVDFACLGTNDLVQYILAVDRDNESVSNWFRTLHPAVIRAIRQVIDAGKKAIKPIVVCGEMAGSPFYTPLLIGLGAVDFSMNLHSIERIMRVIEGIAFEEVAEFAARTMLLSTAEDIENLLLEEIKKKWLHLFPTDFLNLRKI